MKPHNQIVLLRLLRARLARQFRLAQMGHLEEAAALNVSLAQSRRQLEEREGQKGAPDPREARLQEQCQTLNLAILPLLRHEQRLLEREIVELQVERELRRLKDDQK
ncbi:MAG: hypothetical protein K1X75_12835 [Leptospirales bacterium]|nr:hypothetical protein [Leptospirales bacterium]